MEYSTDSSKDIFATIGFHNSTPILSSKNKVSTKLYNNDKNASELNVVSQSFLAYKTKKSILKVGNFLLDTPLINKSSVRIVPWSYQGANFVLKDVFKSSIQLSYINKTRNFTSDIYTKETLAGDMDKGISMLGFKHHPIDLLDVHLYYYHAPSLYDSSFFQLDYKNNKISKYFLYCFGLQHLKTYNDHDANLFGIRTGIFTEDIDITINYSKNKGQDDAKGYGGLSKIYTRSMIANGRGTDNAETIMLKANFELDVIKKHSSEFSVWLTNTSSKTSEYNSYYTHLRHKTNDYTKLYFRYEYIDYEDNSKDVQYLRFLTSIDF